MTPLELFQWSIAVAGGVLLIGFALALALAFILAAIQTAKKRAHLTE